MNRSNARDGGGWAQVNAKQKNDPYAPTPEVTLVVDTRYRYKPGEVVEVIEGPHKGKEATVLCLTVGYEAMDGFSGPAYQVRIEKTLLVRWDWVRPAVEPTAKEE